MEGKIGLEEHFATAETLSDSAAFAPERCWAELSARLLDVAKERIGGWQHGTDWRPWFEMALRASSP